MKLSNIRVDVADTLGSRFALTGIAPKYNYEGGKRTGEVAGHYYSVVCLDRGFMPVRVAIPGDARLDEKAAGNSPNVEFSNLSIKIFYISGKPVISVTAGDVKTLKS